MSATNVWRRCKGGKLIRPHVHSMRNTNPTNKNTNDSQHERGENLFNCYHAHRRTYARCGFWQCNGVDSSEFPLLFFSANCHLSHPLLLLPLILDNNSSGAQTRQHFRPTLEANDFKLNSIAPKVMYARRSNYQTRLRDLKDFFRLHQLPKE